ncbi:MAG: hypothetical protein R3B96_15365 [Pirellulaceae bacterium]
MSLEELASYLHLTGSSHETGESGQDSGKQGGGEWRSESEIHHWLEQQIGVADEQAARAAWRTYSQQRQRKDTDERDIIKVADLIPVDCVKLLDIA